MESCGYPYTWERGQGTPNWTEGRLDRSLVNQGWLTMFNTTKLYNLEVSTSDHSPILMELTSSFVEPRVRRFLFENAWLREPEYTGDFKKRIAICKDEIPKWKLGSDENSTANYKLANKQLSEVYIQQEVFLRQRSKQLWLQEEDNNNKFCHASATSRQRNNLISKLKDNSGRWVDWNSGLPQLMIDYFSNLFTTSSNDWREVTSCVQALVVSINFTFLPVEIVPPYFSAKSTTANFRSSDIYFRNMEMWKTLCVSANVASRAKCEHLLPYLSTTASNTIL
ncbi:hypothetical protein CsatB_017497 [Cannabis sativa]